MAHMLSHTLHSIRCSLSLALHAKHGDLLRLHTLTFSIPSPLDTRHLGLALNSHVRLQGQAVAATLRLARNPSNRLAAMESFKSFRTISSTSMVGCFSSECLSECRFLNISQTHPQSHSAVMVVMHCLSPSLCGMAHNLRAIHGRCTSVEDLPHDLFSCVTEPCSR